MKNEPGALLRDLEVAGQRGAGDPLLMRGHKPDRREPLAERKLRALENGANLDRKALLAIGALVGALVAEVHDALAVAVWAEGAVLPADCGQVVNGRLLVREGFEELE